MKYRKKPIIVEAYQFFPGMLHTPGIRHVPAHCVNMTGKDGEKNRGIIHEAPERWVCDTLEGPLQASAGDFIITGVNGEVYPCKPDIFYKTYEAVDETEITASFHPDSDIGRERARRFLPLESTLKGNPPADRLNPVRIALTLLDVMVRAGEKHSTQSREVVKEAWLILGKGK